MKHFCDKYYVNEFGHLFSYKYGKIKQLKPYINHKGYAMYRLRIGGKTIQYSEHHLSYYCNVRPFDSSDGLHIDHIDTDRLNNHYSNLRRVSRKENARNPITRVANLRHIEKLRQINTKKVPYEVVYNLYCDGLNLSEIGRKVGLSRSTVRRKLRMRY